MCSTSALRFTNDGLPNSDGTEQQWEFGQTATIVLLGDNLVTHSNGVRGEKSIP